MSVIEIKEKLREYIDSANEAELLDLLYTIEAPVDVESDRWNDPGFVKEMRNRRAEIIYNPSLGISIEEATLRVNKAIEDHIKLNEQDNTIA